MTWFLAAAMLLFLHPASARAELVLNEILYDPAGADDGHEFVELWNPDSIPRALDGVVIEAADGARAGVWAAVFRGVPGDTVLPGRAFLVAGAALSGALQNGPDAIRLARDGRVLDLLGYGDVAADGLFEGAPAPDAVSGHSLARRVDGADTDRNAEDWEDEPAPTPGLANHPDERLELAPGGMRLDPVVAWPGESVVVRVLVKNRGRLPIEGVRWRLIAEREDAPGSAGRGGGYLPAAEHPGVSLAPGDSASLRLSIEPAAEGAFRVMVRTAAADAAAPGNTGSSGGGVADTAFAAGRTRASPAVIHEIAFRDAGAGEWIELWVREALPDVGSLAIADAASPERPIARGPVARPFPAGSLVIVAQDPAAVRARFGLDSSSVFGVEGGWPSLNDTPGDADVADVVRVTDAEGFPSDIVPYEAGAVSRAGTLERLSPDLPGHLAGSWGECVDPARATAGRANSLRAPDGPGGASRGALLVASGSVLRRGPGAAPLLLRLTAEARGRPLDVRVYDLLGRRVRALVVGQRFASDGAFAWDGRDDAGSWVEPGLYVIAAEAAPSEGRGPRRTALCVAVAADRTP